MKMASLAVCCVLAAAPALAQQRNDVLDTLKGALGSNERQDDRTGRAAAGQADLPRDSRGNVDLGALNDRQLLDYQASLERELEVTEDEVRRRRIGGR